MPWTDPAPTAPATPATVSAPGDRAGAILTIDLDAAAANYRRLCAELAGTDCAVVVKADGYGLGVDRLAPVFVRAGARTFFVATIDEALGLRTVLDAAGCPEAAVYVLNGPLPGTEADLLAARIIPVLNSLGQIALWAEAARQRGRRLQAALHVDTGMSRLGLPDDEVAALAEAPQRLDGLEITLLLSHLACADTPAHPENAAQLARLQAARRQLPLDPGVAVSLANSSGIFLGGDYHFDLARPGVALYGVNPTPGRPSPMHRVVTLRGRVLQVRQIDHHRGVGYGASFRAGGPTRVATVAAGYADGYLRHLSNAGRVAFGGQLLPVIGRVSMDSFTVDVTGLGRDGIVAGDFVEIIGDGHDQDAIAAEAGTIGYEILTALGARYHRVYRGGDG